MKRLGRLLLVVALLGVLLPRPEAAGAVTTSELITNVGFEGTISPWTLGDAGVTNTGSVWKASGDLPHTGAGNVLLGGGVFGRGAVWQLYKAPVSAPGLIRLQYWIHVSATGDDDTLTIQMYDASGYYQTEWFANPLNRFETVQLDNIQHGFYVQRVAYAPAYGGERRLIAFHVDSATANVRIDDVSLTYLPEISPSPASMSFEGPAGGVSPAPQTLWIANTGGADMNFSVSDDQSWLSVSPASGTASREFTVSHTVTVSTSGLAAGTYTGTITVSATGATNTPVKVPVTLAVRGPALAASPGSLSFSGPLGGANPASKALTISNTGGGLMYWGVSDNQAWLSVSPTSGSLGVFGSATATVSVNTAGLAAGTYSGTITITASATNSPVTVAVTLTVTPPTLNVVGVNPDFFADVGGANPASQTVSIRNDGGGSLSWVLADDQPWLSVSPTSGTLGVLGSATATISVNTTGLAIGTYNGTITVSAAGVAGSPRTRAVTLEVRSTGNRIINGGFESGFDSWGLVSGARVQAAGTTAGSPRTGTSFLLLAGSGATAFQRIVIPPGATTANLSFWLNVTSPETTTAMVDKLNVEIHQDAGSILTFPTPLLSTRATYSNLDKGAAGVYTLRGSFDLTAFQGIPVRVQFTTSQNGTLLTSFRIDDVALEVTDGPPKLFASPSSMSFGASAGGVNPPSKTLLIRNDGGGTMSWAAPDNQPWLIVSPASGSLASAGGLSPTVSINTAGLAAGTYTGSITVSATGAANSPFTTSVTLVVSPPGELIANGGFEASATPWVLSGTTFWASSGSPHTGTGYAYLSDRNFANGQIDQVITIPSTATSANLTFWLSIGSSETTTTLLNDKLFVEITDAASAPLTTLATYSNLNRNLAYEMKGGFSLLAYKGSTIRVRFRTVTDGSLLTIFRIDDVSVR